MSDTYLPDEMPSQGDDGGVQAAAVAGLTIAHLSPSRLAWRRFRAHRMAIVSLFVLLIIALLSFFPWLVTDRGPSERMGLEARMQEPTLQVLPPSLGEFPFGTDRNQYDMFARTLHAGQISLQVGLAVALAAGFVGTTVGMLAGYFGGWVDTVLMRIVDLFIAVPVLVGLIIVTEMPAREAWAATWLGEPRSMRVVITALSLFFWMIIARLVRAQVMSLKEKEFVEAARALGASNGRIMVRHLLPNTAGTIVVAVTLVVAAAILAESVLSFLGFGVDIFTPTWGNMLNDGRNAVLSGNTHLVWFPGMAIVITVLCVNYIGDGLRDALDPRQLMGGK